MSQASDQEPVYERSSFIKVCGYCGARFAVFAQREVGSGEEQRYNCPECGKNYRVHAALEPRLSLLAERTDGKDDRYEETMF
jgi:uncharacterized Zn-finger protein